MDHAQSPHVAAIAGPAAEPPRRASVVGGLRGRVLGAILVVALTTLAVGGFGIQRMSMLSDQAQTVYDDGAVPLDALRQLQSTWWEFSAQTARANIAGLPPATIAKSQQGAVAAMQRMTDLSTRIAALPLDADTRAAFEAVGTATQAYLTALTKLQAAGLRAPLSVIGPLLQAMDTNETTIEDSLVQATDAAAATMIATVSVRADS